MVKVLDAFDQELEVGQEVVVRYTVTKVFDPSLPYNRVQVVAKYADGEDGYRREFTINSKNVEVLSASELSVTAKRLDVLAKAKETKRLKQIVADEAAARKNEADRAAEVKKHEDAVKAELARLRVADRVTLPKPVVAVPASTPNKVVVK